MGTVVAFEATEHDEESDEKEDVDEVMELLIAVAVTKTDEELVDEDWIVEVVTASTNIWTVDGALAQAR